MHAAAAGMAWSFDAAVRGVCALQSSSYIAQTHNHESVLHMHIPEFFLPFTIIITIYSLGHINFRPKPILELRVEEEGMNNVYLHTCTCYIFILCI